jgi:hypothetical protein
MPVLESWVEKNVNKEVRKWGILYLKMRPIENGYPDRCYILPNGLHVWIEFKRPVETGLKRNAPEKLQIYRMKQLKRRRVVVGWTDDYRVAIDVLKALVVAARLSKARNTTAPRAGLWGIILGSRLGENFDLSGFLQDLKEAGISPEDADSCTVTADDGDVVGRD